MPGQSGDQHDWIIFVLTSYSKHASLVIFEKLCSKISWITLVVINSHFESVEGHGLSIESLF